MEKDSLIFIEEKKLQKEIQEQRIDFLKSTMQTNPIKDMRAQLARFRLNKKKINPQDLI